MGGGGGGLGGGEGLGGGGVCGEKISHADSKADKIRDLTASTKKGHGGGLFCGFQLRDKDLGNWNGALPTRDIILRGSSGC